MASEPKTASKLPVIMGWVALGISLVLLAIPYLFTSNSDWVTPLVGWFLTPGTSIHRIVQTWDPISGQGMTMAKSLS